MNLDAYGTYEGGSPRYVITDTDSGTILHVEPIQPSGSRATAQADAWATVIDIIDRLRKVSEGMQARGLPVGEWNTADSNAARCEGWNVSNSGTDEASIQKYDDTSDLTMPHGHPIPALDADETAWSLVVSKARGGSALHLNALRAVTDIERLWIAKHCGPLPSLDVATQTGSYA